MIGAEGIIESLDASGRVCGICEERELPARLGSDRGKSVEAIVMLCDGTETACLLWDDCDEECAVEPFATFSVDLALLVSSDHKKDRLKNQLRPTNALQNVPFLATSSFRSRTLTSSSSSAIRKRD